MDTKVIAESQRFVALKVDMTNDTPSIAKKFTIVNPPALVFLDDNGEPRADLHLINKEVGPDRFLATLKKVS